jgi:O-antigen/teichoic acid export membrane protein
MAQHRWRVSADRESLATLARFAAPLWIAGLPLALVLHGERAIVGAAQGAEAIAGFAAAAMVAAALGAIAARIGQALILPAMVEARDTQDEAAHRLELASDLSAVAASGIIAATVVGGAAIMTLLFGWRYGDTGAVLACLVAGAAIKIFQAPVSLASMATGQTRVFVWASVARALALLPLAALATGGASLASVAAASAAAELLSLAMFVHGAPDRRVAVRTAVRGLAAIVACTGTAAAAVSLGASGLSSAMLAAALASLATALALPAARRLATDAIIGWRSEPAFRQ